MTPVLCLRVGLVVQEDGLSSAIFTVSNDVGSLSHVLAAFQQHGVNLSHIESRPNKGAYVPPPPPPLACAHVVIGRCAARYVCAFL